MAISYDFEIAAALPVHDVAAVLGRAVQEAGLLHAPVTPEELLEKGAETIRGTFVQAFEERPQPWHPVVSDLGFTPTVSVSFRLGKFTDLPGQQDDMIRVVDALLARIPGDAVLEHQSEDIWLLRRAGVLALSEDDELWPSHRLALLNHPYHRTTYTFADD
ncbi:SitI3 family protein [Streptomyces sp. NRRL F-5126]|uniref:SitI3 family protein n=1 Tax=Streptomyces sp. NRRL F-5126 TaxID=1463857 RepID=UPI0004CA1D29|nr:SitI3 family protein [Streptomyces sp. NRRL F-5126]